MDLDSLWNFSSSMLADILIPVRWIIFLRVEATYLFLVILSDSFFDNESGFSNSHTTARPPMFATTISFIFSK